MSSIRNLTVGCLAVVTACTYADDALEADTFVPNAGMMRYPDVSANHIVFAYADDLWVVPRGGGIATLVTSASGPERYPKFSPDGRSIAFLGNYDGDRDLYTISTFGGVPHRVTHHPFSQIICDWTADDRLLFYMTATAGRANIVELFTVAPEGGLPQKLPVPYGANGAISEDGKWLAYSPHSTSFVRNWKRYRGGTATDIWLFHLEDHSWRPMTDWEGTDTSPMWHGDTIYYVSDAGPGHRLNIWAYDTVSGDRRQVTRYQDHDVKWPSIGPGPDGQGEIVFQCGGDLHLLDLEREYASIVEVRIPGDRPRVGTQAVDASELIQWFQISPTGKRAVVEARGDVWTLPAEHGSPRNLTRTSGAAERNPSWSPDGQWICYFSDGSGEYELYLTQSDGKGESRRLTSGSTTYYGDPQWSPDSNRITYLDKAGRLWMHAIDSGETVIIAEDPWGKRRGIGRSWSHDSRWLAYENRKPGAFEIFSIWIYDTESGEKRQVTGDMASDGWPAFDRKGDYLYFASTRSLTPTFGDLDRTWIFEDTGVLVAVPLRADVGRPNMPESDEEEWGERDEETERLRDGVEEKEEEEESEPDDGVTGRWEGTLTAEPFPDGLPFELTLVLEKGGVVSGSTVLTDSGGDKDLGTIVDGSYDAGSGDLLFTVTHDFGLTVKFTVKVEGTQLTGKGFAVEQGIEAELTAARVTTEAAAADSEAAERVEIDFDGFERRAFRLDVPAGTFRSLVVNDRNQLVYVRTSQRGSNDGAAIKLYDMHDDAPAEKTVAAGPSAFELSADGKKLIASRGGKRLTIHNASAGAGGKPVITRAMTASIDVQQERRQIFDECWRLYRDFFYDPGMHGLDWAAMRDEYAPLLDDCASREDLSYVINEMLGELSVGHAGEYGPQDEEQPDVETGMLAVDFTLENGAYRISRIHEGAEWELDYRNPLRAPGVDVDEGDYLLAVNGLPLDPSRDPWAAFGGRVGLETTLTVSAKPEWDEDARDVVVEPLMAGDAWEIRYRGWMEGMRQHVDEQSGGRVGYIYLPNFVNAGLSNLAEQFYAQRGKDALIIDERWNTGGWTPDRFVELLNRPISMYRARADGVDRPVPNYTHAGPKCVLMNSLSGSSGDMFPWMFRHAGLGKLIGTRTWGGVVGLSGNPQPIDGATLRVPTDGTYETDGTWIVEGHGVDPDIEVVDDPSKMVDGGDPQLDAAIAHLLAELERGGYAHPARPAGPNRTGWGTPLEDR